MLNNNLKIIQKSLNSDLEFVEQTSTRTGERIFGANLKTFETFKSETYDGDYNRDNLTITYSKMNASKTRELKAEFEEFKKADMLSMREIISLLSRTDTGIKQRGKDWFLQKEITATSTQPHIDTRGQENQKLWDVVAFNIAQKMGGEHEIAIRQSMATTRDAVNKMNEYLYDGDEEEILGFEAPVDRGNKLEKIILEQMEEDLGVEIKEGGFTVLDNTSIGDSPDGSTVTSNTFEMETQSGEVITIPRGSRCGIEVKAPSFANYINPDYIKKHNQQLQQHMIVNNYDYVIYAKGHREFPNKYNVVELDEDYAKIFLEGMLIFDEKIEKETNKIIEEAILWGM